MTSHRMLCTACSVRPESLCHLYQQCCITSEATQGAVSAELSLSASTQMLSPPGQLSHSVSVPAVLGSVLVPMLQPMVKAPTVQPVAA